MLVRKNVLYSYLMKPMEKIAELGLKLPVPPTAAGLYKPTVIDGDMIFFSGHLPILLDGSLGWNWKSRK